MSRSGKVTVRVVCAHCHRIYEGWQRTIGVGYQVRSHKAIGQPMGGNECPGVEMSADPVQEVAS